MKTIVLDNIHFQSSGCQEFDDYFVYEIYLKGSKESLDILEESLGLVHKTTCELRMLFNKKEQVARKLQDKMPQEFLNQLAERIV